jgi:hypothetical protein
MAGQLRYSLFLVACLACGSRVIGRLDERGTGGVSSTATAAGGLAAGANEPGASGGASSPVPGAGGMPLQYAGGGGAPGSAAAAGEENAGAGEAGAGGRVAVQPKALLLIDARLYALLREKLEQYRALAEQRRGFAIELRVETGLDERSFVELKSWLTSEHQRNPELEGVLFIGNVAVPTFYKPRNDNLATRLYPYFYEDLDATWLRAQDPGTLDPLCLNQPGQVQQNCNVLADTTVPPHDYDRLIPGPSLGPELWSAYWPVGISGGPNDYAAFAAQLSPYLDKLIAHYSGQIASNGRYYFVSNDPLWNTLELLWNSAPRTALDFYGKPGPQGQVGSACIVGAQNLCYVRWPLESYDSFAAFRQAYEAEPFVGEGWQQPSIFSAHMNAALYDMVEVNVPSDSGLALLDTAETAALSHAGLIVALGGSSVVGFAEPRAACSVDIQNVLPSSSVGVAYLYGKSQALAVLGDPTQRGHAGNFPVVYATLKTTPGAYLGKAHRAQMLQNYADAGYEQCVAANNANCGYTVSETASEMLLGDPFLDLSDSAP